MNNIEISKIFNIRSFCDQTYQDMAEISKPLLNKFGLSGFAYVRLYDDNTCLYLHTSPHLARYLIENEVHVSAHVPEEILNDEFWFVIDSKGPYSPHFRALKDITNASSACSYIRRFHGYYEMFCFLAPEEQSVALNIFLNNKKILENYASDFVFKAKNLISFLDRDRFVITEAMKPNFRGLQSDEQISCINLQKYLTNIQAGFNHLNSNNVLAFSSQQLKCIEFFMYGKTVSDIAKNLKVSVGTIETNLNLIKEKIGCRKNSDIIDTLIELHDQSELFCKYNLNYFNVFFKNLLSISGLVNTLFGLWLPFDVEDTQESDGLNKRSSLGLEECRVILGLDSVRSYITRLRKDRVSNSKLDIRLRCCTFSSTLKFVGKELHSNLPRLVQCCGWVFINANKPSVKQNFAGKFKHESNLSINLSMHGSLV